MPRRISRAVVIALLAVAPFAAACTSPVTTVLLENNYAPSPTRSLVVYRAYWEAVSFPDPIPPGSSSAPESAVPASANTAYVLLAPGWDPTSSTPPTSFVVMESRNGFGVHLGDTLQIPVGDTTFVGNCASGSFLPQAEADFILQQVFSPGVFLDGSAPAPFHYDAATCTTTPIDDAGAP